MSAGPRITRQQRAIERAIEHARRPLSPSELLALARREQPSLSQATVYRTLKRLADEGAVARVDLPGQAPRYESREAAGKHHHHFVCRVCDRVYDIHGCARGVDALAPAGFSVEEHEIVLFGRCEVCAAGD